MVDEAARTQLARVDTRTVRAQQKAAIAALLREPTPDAAAARAGITVSQLLEWLDDPTFNAEYRAARQAAADEGVTDAVIRLQQRADAAVDALTRNLTCGVPAVEVEAAKAILEHAVEASERSRGKPASREKRP